MIWGILLVETSAPQASATQLLAAAFIASILLQKQTLSSFPHEVDEETAEVMQGWEHAGRSDTLSDAARRASTPWRAKILDQRIASPAVTLVGQLRERIDVDRASASGGDARRLFSLSHFGRGLPSQILRSSNSRSETDPSLGDTRVRAVRPRQP